MKQVGFEGETRHPNEAKGLQAMFDRHLKLPKLAVIDPNEDNAFISKVAHVMRRGEKLMQFVARVGLGRAQALTMTRDEISAFAESAEANHRNEFAMPSPATAPQRLVPTRPLVLVG